MGLGMTAVRPGHSVRQSNLPSFAEMPAMLCIVSCTYCGAPLIVAGTSDEYCAESVKSLLCQSTAPVILSSAAMAPCEPPGVQTTFGPSMRGDSAYPHPKGLPPRSVM